MIKYLFFISAVGIGYADAVNTMTDTLTLNTAVITTYKTVIRADNANGLLFTGKAMACAKPGNPQDPDCCATIGWGSDHSLDSCMPEEQSLAVARNAGLAVYVGDTCMQNNGTCETPMSVYCVFPDPVSYQAQMQGRAQLGIGFGTPATPDCNGLSATQIKQIDFTRINFAMANS